MWRRRLCSRQLIDREAEFGSAFIVDGSEDWPRIRQSLIFSVIKVGNATEQNYNLRLGHQGNNRARVHHSNLPSMPCLLRTENNISLQWQGREREFVSTCSITEQADAKKWMAMGPITVREGLLKSLQWYAISNWSDRYFDPSLSQFQLPTLRARIKGKPIWLSNLSGEGKPFIKKSPERRTWYWNLPCPGFRIGYESKCNPLSYPALYNCSSENGKWWAVYFIRRISKGNKFRKVPGPRFWQNIRSLQKRPLSNQELLEGVVSHGKQKYLHCCYK